MSWTDNPVRDADRYFAEQEEKLERLPVCFYCGEHIQQEDAVYLEDLGRWVCDGCLDDMRTLIDD